MRLLSLPLIALAVALSQGAVAADAPSRTRTPNLLAPKPVANWEGIYVGRTFGYGISRVRSRDVGTASFNMNGTSGSNIIGYNLQSGSWVYGVEGDISIHEIKGRTAGGAGIAGHQGDNLWTSALKARLGYDMGRFLPYVTAGVAVGELHLHNWPGTFYFGDVKYQTGYTVGAGVDARVWDNIHARIEYGFTDFGRERYNLVGSTISSDMSTHMFRAGLIYRVGGKSTPAASSAASGAVDWSGRYAGLQVGWRGTMADTNDPLGFRGSFDATGALGGIYGGQNWMLGRWLVGIDSEVMIAGVNAAKAAGALPAMQYSEIWTAAARLRGGYSFGAFLPYITAGIQYGQFEQAVPGTGSTAVEPIHSWTVGAGLDYRFAQNYSARIDYAYARSFDTANPGLDATRYSTKTENHTVKLGIAYHFGK